jgi:hypothetical protein
MQPELVRIAEKRRARTATEMAFLPVEFACVEHFSAPTAHSFRFNFFITAILLSGEQSGLLSQWTFIGQGGKPTPDTQVRREAAGRIPITLCGPPNLDISDQRPNLI